MQALGMSGELERWHRCDIGHTKLDLLPSLPVIETQGARDVERGIASGEQGLPQRCAGGTERHGLEPRPITGREREADVSSLAHDLGEFRVVGGKSEYRLRVTGPEGSR